ncbi:MAG: phytoene desaturase family protein [Anaerolineae bacterium]
MTTDYDAVIVGSGPNGLAAAITLAEAGCSVLVIEARERVGGGTRTEELTLPGFQHDICSAIHPLAIASPFFKGLDLTRYGLEWIQPQAQVAHPLSDGDAVIIEHDIDATARTLGADADRYRQLIGALRDHQDELLHDFLAPLKIPRYPVVFGLFGLMAILPASTFARLAFREDRTQAMFAGMAAHSIQALENPATAAFGLMLLMLTHKAGWGMAKGGSHAITRAMAQHLEALGGTIITGTTVQSLDDIPSSRRVIFNLTPRQILSIAGDALPAGYRRRMARYRYGAGVFKIDYALSEPVPWRNPAVARAGTVHIGGTLSEIAQSERLCVSGIHSDAPYVLIAQHSLFDDTRAPQDKHTLWAYCHVPHGSTRDMTEVIERQIEQHAPGFRDVVLARHTMNTVAMERYNPNYIGGDINGGIQDLTQLFTRPVARLSPYSTPNPRLFIASSSVPPGGGVHGMGGYHCAQAILRTL